jgi:hypothetical protein
VAHTSSFAVLLFGLAAAWSALRSGRPRLIAAAALLCALTVSFNFYGATALGILFSLMVWTLWAVDGGAAIWRRAAAITALAYALSAWWLTPSFLKLTARNLTLVAESATPGSQALALAVLAAFALAARFFGRGHPERAWPLLLAGGVSLFGLATVGAYYFRFHAIGDSKRLMPEFELLLILAAVTCLGARRRVVAVTAVLALAGLLALAVPYLLHPLEGLRVGSSPRTANRVPPGGLVGPLPSWQPCVHSRVAGFLVGYMARRAADRRSFGSGHGKPEPRLGKLADRRG